MPDSQRETVEDILKKTSVFISGGKGASNLFAEMNEIIVKKNGKETTLLESVKKDFMDKHPDEGKALSDENVAKYFRHKYYDYHREQAQTIGWSGIQ